MNFLSTFRSGSDTHKRFRSTMAWGLEARVPFLDKAFLEVALNIDPKEKMFSKGSAQEVDADGCPKMEKYILRKAFDCAPDGKVGSISRQDCKGFVLVLT